MKLSECPKDVGCIGFWDKKINNYDDIGFFIIAQHVSINTIEVNNFIDGVDYLRCDASARTGPTGLHEWDSDNNVCSCGKSEKPHGLTNMHGTRFDTITAIFPIIEAVPYGHIVYVELLKAEDEIIEIEEQHSNCARTLQETFRLLLEWDWAYTNLNNREKIAVVSHGMVQTLNIPEEIKNWLMESVPSEKVGRFLEGRLDAQKRADIETIPDISDEFSEWLYEKISTVRPFGSYDL